MKQLLNIITAYFCLILDPLNQQHLYALQLVYLPRINNAIKIFTHGWNSHILSGTKGKSPLQLYTQGMLTLKDRQLPALDFTCPVDQDYGTCDDVSSSESDVAIIIPPISLNLTYNQQLALKDHILPYVNTESDFHHVDLYLKCLSIIV